MPFCHAHGLRFHYQQAGEGPDVLLVRHVIEHCYDIHAALRALRSLVRPGGYVVFEMPDARRALDRLDYSTIWEEHLFYFTPATIRQALAVAGLAKIRPDRPQTYFAFVTPDERKCATRVR